MSVWKIVKLDFGRSPAHFGELGIGMEETSDHVRSDSLFSAWISIYARLFGKDEVEELLQQFPSDKQSESKTPPFRLSSTFIYRKYQEDTIYYLPRPLKFPINYPQIDIGFFKTYKKLNYLPLTIWHRWYQAQGFQDADKEELIAYTRNGRARGELSKLGTFDYKTAYKTDKVPKIAVDRVTRATNLYQTGFVQFDSEKNPAGLYFLLQLSTEDEDLENKLKAALYLLGEEGLGGERSSGAGRFKFIWSDLEDIWQQVINFKDGTYETLISLFWDFPLSTDFLSHASYEIQERGGWIGGNQLRRKMVRMFSEGSVFEKLRDGKLVDVTPNEFKKHRVYRSGISLSLPIKVKNE